MRRPPTVLSLPKNSGAAISISARPANAFWVSLLVLPMGRSTAVLQGLVCPFGRTQAAF